MSDIGRLGISADALGRVPQAAGLALTDGMVERLAGTVANLLEIADRLDDPDVRDGIARILEAVGAFQRSGALTTVLDTIALLRAAHDRMGETLVERAERLAAQADGLAAKARATVEEAAATCTAAGDGGGLLTTLRLLSQPETVQALRFALALGDGLRRRVQPAEAPAA